MHTGKSMGGSKVTFASDCVPVTDHFGRHHKMNLAYVKKHMLFSKEVYRFGALSLQSAAQGSLTFQRNLSGTPPTAGVIEFMPIYLLGITEREQAQAAPLVPSFWRLNRIYQGGGDVTYNWATTNGYNQLGVTVNQWQLEASPYADEIATQQTVPRDVLEWVEFKMRAIGPTSQPCKWHVKLIQFKELHFMPDWSNSNTFTTSATYDLESLQTQRNKFYDALTQPLVMNRTNMFASGYDIKKGIHTLKDVAFKTSPKSTTDEYVTGECRDVKLFMNLNRKQKYNWNPNSAVPYQPIPTGTVEQPNYFVPTINGPADCVTDVAPKARMYIMIQAESWFPNDSTIADCPSFDFLARKRHTVLMV